MKNNNLNLIINLFFLVTLFSNLSIAQESPDKTLTETPNQLSDEKQTIKETVNLQTTGELTIIESDNVDSNATGTIIAEYFYDHEGKRILKKVYNISGTNNNESTYYMNTRPADFIQVINTNGTIINETYIYLQDKLIAKFDTNGRKFFYHPDHLGSTSLVTNESGDVVEDLLYLPYGELLNVQNEIPRFTYTGQEKDQESDFMNYGDGERSYYPKFSRFLQPDKIIQNIFNSQNLNRYSYVLNNPYKYVDSTGNLIELVVRTAHSALGVFGGAHAYFQITPDNPSAFPQYGKTFTLDASRSDGLLKSRTNYNQENNGPSESAVLETPQGDTEAIQALLDTAKAIDEANIDYDILPNLFSGEGENSNSFATTLVSEAGLDLPDGTNYNQLDPKGKTAAGLGRIFDIDSYGKMEKYYYNPIGNKFFNFQKNERPNRPSGGAWGWNEEEGWWRVKGT